MNSLIYEWIWNSSSDLKTFDPIHIPPHQCWCERIWGLILQCSKSGSRSKFKAQASWSMIRPLRLFFVPVRIDRLKLNDFPRCFFDLRAGHTSWVLFSTKKIGFEKGGFVSPYTIPFHHLNMHKNALRETSGCLYIQSYHTWSKNTQIFHHSHSSKSEWVFFFFFGWLWISLGRLKTCSELYDPRHSTGVWLDIYSQCFVSRSDG